MATTTTHRHNCPRRTNSVQARRRRAALEAHNRGLQRIIVLQHRLLRLEAAWAGLPQPSRRLSVEDVMVIMQRGDFTDDCRRAELRALITLRRYLEDEVGPWPFPLRTERIETARRATTLSLIRTRLYLGLPPLPLPH